MVHLGQVIIPLLFPQNYKFDFYLMLFQILVNSLRCFLILLRFPLPSLRSTMPQFLDRLFVLLADYTTSNAIGNLQEYVPKSVEVSQLVFKVDFFFSAT